MNNAYSKVVTILLTSVLMFCMPMLCMLERQKNVEQIYILTESVYFVDSICNTGHLTRRMYEEFLKKIAIGNRLYHIQLVHETKEAMWVEEQYQNTSTFYTTKEIVSAIYKGEGYFFQYQDYFKVVVKEKKTNEVIAYYGGGIKYEKY